MRDRAPYLACAFLAAACFGLVSGCKAIPCTSVDAMRESFDVFLEDHFNYVDHDDSLSTEEKQIIHRHALGHKELIERLRELCGE
jgi:hypothetical protein